MALRVLVVLLAVLVVMPAPAAAADPLIGVVDRDGHPGSLARLDPLTLRPASRRVALRGYLWGHGTSTDRSAVAVGVSRKRNLSIQVVDVIRWRTLRTIPMRDVISAISWPRADRMVVVEGNGVAVLDPGRGRVLRRIAIPGSWRDAQPTATGLAVLSTPRRAIGHARLTIVDAEGGARTILLERVEAGFVPPPSNNLKAGEIPISHEVVPALAVDRDGARAFVVAAGLPLVEEIDLATGTASPHPMIPAARASKATEGLFRSARWLGGGLLAVTGQDAFLSDGDEQRIVPFGVQVVDTRTWTTRRVDGKASWFVAARAGVMWIQDGALRSWDEASGRRAYDLRGRVSAAVWGGRYLYASVRGRHRMYVMSARGRTVRVLPSGQLPLLLMD